MISNHFSLLKDAFSFVQQTLLAIIFAYCIEYPVFINFFPKDTVFAPILFFLSVILRVVFYAGIYGNILEIILGRTVGLSLNRIKINFLKYWKAYVIAVSCLYLIHMVIFAFVRSVTTEQFLVYMDVVFALGFSNYLFRKESKGFAVDFSFQQSLFFAGTIFVFYLLSIGFYHLYLFSFFDGKEVFRFSMVLTRIIHFSVIIFTWVYLQSRGNRKENFPEIYLINPVYGGSLLHELTTYMRHEYAAIFSVIKALTVNSQYRFKEFNRVRWRDKYFTSGKLVCITSYTSNVHEAYYIAKGFKAKGSTVIMGGPHAMFMPQEALAFCDCVVVGDAEGLWNKVLKDYESGSLKKVYQREDVSFDEYEEGLSRVRQYLADVDPYEAKSYVEVMRGCKFDCSFCTIPALNNGKVYTNKLEDVSLILKNIKKKYNRVSFVDNNIYSSPKLTREFLEMIKPLNLKWDVSSSIDIAKNDDILRLAKESGCTNLLIGYEVFGDKTQRSEVGKKVGMADKYYEYTKKIKKQGIEIKGHFIFGFDGDSFKKLWSMWKCCFRIFPHITSVLILTPYPGTQLFDQVIKEDRIINLNWKRYTSNEGVIEFKGADVNVLNYFWPVLMFGFFITTSFFGLQLLVIIILTTINIFS